ncbi:MAG: holo-ACP synthase [Candidatus Omnitrophica bacterium]|nr:holo-ACP synthase [Candidatus Omnitrophota bacterium]
MHYLSGMDLVEIEEIRSKIEAPGAFFLEENFTPAEIEYCESHKKNKYEHYAGRYAVKRAFLKAVSLGAGPIVRLSDVEVTRNGRAPRLELSSGLKQKLKFSPNTKIYISLAHERALAVGTALIAQS